MLCFVWSISASIHNVDDHPYRVSKNIPYQIEPNIDNIDFTKGMKIVDIPKFESINPTLSTNVFEYSTDDDNAYKLVS